MKLLVASGNPKKLGELARILTELRIDAVELVSLDDVPPYPCLLYTSDAADE